MIVRQAPAVSTVVGIDQHRGWLPPRAAEPLPTVPEPSWLDVRITKEGANYTLSWHPHEPAHQHLPSAQGERRFQNLTQAEADALELFGVGPDEWLIRADAEAVTASDIAAMRDTVLQAHQIDDPSQEGWGALSDPPKQVTLTVPNGAPVRVWLVFEEGGEGYSVFYDPATGDCGLATGGTYLGDYGSLWMTLQSM
jgi:hypothetical protein